jgi:high-affinity Fe2+/Pb2+ permease
MKLLAWLTEMFINTFGITRPRPEQQRTAQLVIGGFLLAVILAVAAAATILFVAIHSGSAR